MCKLNERFNCTSPNQCQCKTKYNSSAKNKKEKAKLNINVYSSSSIETHKQHPKTVIMELIIVSIVLLATLYFLYSVLNSGSSSSTKNGKQQLPLPPGAKGWPLVGETLAYLQGSKKGVPEKFIAERRDKFSTTIFKSPLLNENMVFFCTAEGNKFLFANENKLVKSWWPKTFEKIFAPSEKTTQGEETMRMRKVLSPFLKPDSLQKYIGVMDSETQKHLKTYWDAKEVTVYPLAKKYTFAVGCKLFLNIDNPETIAMLEEPIRHISSGFVSSFPVNIPGTKYHKAIQAAKKIRTDIKHLVAQRRRDILEGRAPKSPDILSHLLMETYENGELINDSDIANKIYGLLHGAYDNVSALLSSIIAYLAELPEVYDRVRSGKPYFYLFIFYMHRNCTLLFFMFLYYYICI